jgi:hypothetical protein
LSSDDVKGAPGILITAELEVSIVQIIQRMEIPQGAGFPCTLQV